jgi:hypothetical protein
MQIYVSAFDVGESFKESLSKSMHCNISEATRKLPLDHAMPHANK